MSIFPKDGTCPVFGVKLKFGVNGDCCYDNSPSLDQIIPAAGYTRGNVRVISYRANVLRNNATIEELEMLLADAKKPIKTRS